MSAATQTLWVPPPQLKTWARLLLLYFMFVTWGFELSFYEIARAPALFPVGDEVLDAIGVAIEGVRVDGFGFLAPGPNADPLWLGRPQLGHPVSGSDFINERDEHRWRGGARFGSPPVR